MVDIVSLRGESLAHCINGLIIYFMATFFIPYVQVCYVKKSVRNVECGVVTFLIWNIGRGSSKFRNIIGKYIFTKKLGNHALKSDLKFL